MAKTITMILIIGGLLMTGCRKNPDPHNRESESTTGLNEQSPAPVEKTAPEEASTKPDILSPQDEATLRKWLDAEKDIAGTEKVARICLRAKLSRSRIIELIGKPNCQAAVGSEYLCYRVIPSQPLTFDFDKAGMIIGARAFCSPVELPQE